MMEDLLEREDVIQGIERLVDNLVSRNYAALGITDPNRYEVIEEFLSLHPQNFTKWRIENARYSLIPYDDNEYFLSTSLVSQDGDENKFPSDLYAQILIRTSPLEFELLNVTI